MKRYIIGLIILLLAMTSRAQELTVKLMTAAPLDLSASQYERKDLAGNACGLVKVQLAASGAQFEGNVIGSAEYKTGEYWVYMTEGSYMLSVKHPSFVPLDVNFRDYGIIGIEGKVTYKLTLLLPDQKKQKLTINYTPATAMVIIDSKIYRGNGYIELELPVGDHNYVIAEDGYDPIEGVAKLNANSPRVITETLIQASTSQPVATDSKTTPQVSSPPTVQLSEGISSMPQNQDIKTFTVNGVSFNMIRVDGGTFTMGATSEQGSDAYDYEKPAHQVTLSSYYIGETEVTQSLWEAVMGSNPSYFKGSNKPVEQVSWKDCQKFIDKLNKETGLCFRLPTEAEWEYAARGGNKSRGYKYSGSNSLVEVAWYTGNSGSSTHDVKTKQANELGVYDMSGNVWEWVQDWMGDYSSSAQTNPKGQVSGSDRVGRGGGWNGLAGNCRVSDRSYGTPVSRFNGLGLRLALQ